MSSPAENSKVDDNLSPFSQKMAMQEGKWAPPSYILQNNTFQNDYEHSTGQQNSNSSVTSITSLTPIRPYYESYPPSAYIGTQYDYSQYNTSGMSLVITEFTRFINFFY